MALAARGWRPALWPAGLAGAAFLAGHALIHLVGFVAGHSETVFLETATVVLSALAALWAAFPEPTERRLSHA